MHRLAFILLCLLAVPALLYVGLVTYFFATGQLTQPAALAGSYGVVFGMITIAGISLATRFLGFARSGDGYLPGYVLAVCTLALVGLFAVMDRSGDFGVRVFGAHTYLFEIGYYCGVPFGIALVAALWFDAKREP